MFGHAFKFSELLVKYSASEDKKHLAISLVKIAFTKFGVLKHVFESIFSGHGLRCKFK